MTRVVVGVRPAGGWVPYGNGLYGYACDGDGNCFWRAAAVQLYGEQDAYARVRTEVAAYVRAHAAMDIEGLPLAAACEASGYASVDAWVAALLTDREFGGYLEAAVAARCYGLQVEVYLAVPGAPSQVFNAGRDECLRFHFHAGHYDALFYE